MTDTKPASYTKCPTHGRSKVVGPGPVVGSSDPHATDRLACGCVVGYLGLSDDDVFTVSRGCGPATCRQPHTNTCPRCQADRDPATGSCMCLK